MKIMPIMTNKNDCLQKQQCKTHAPSFNGYVKLKAVVGKNNFTVCGHYLAAAQKKCLRDIERGHLKVSPMTLRLIEKFDPYNIKEIDHIKPPDNVPRTIVFGFNDAMDKYAEEAMERMKRALSRTKYNACFNGKFVTVE